MGTQIWNWEKLDQSFNSIREYITLLACPFFLFFFLLWDVGKAYKTNSHWVPARVLTLNAFTILLLNQAANVDDTSTATNVIDVLARQHVIDSTRLMKCAFMAYIVPEVGQFGFTKTRDYLGTFTIVVVSQMAYQMYLVIHKPLKAELSKIQVTWFMVSTSTSFSVLVSLLGLLFTSVATAKTMKSIAVNNIKRIKIKENDPYMEEFFCTLYLIVRSSQTSFLVARSYLISTAALLTSMVIGMHLIKWIHLRTEDIFKTLDRPYQFAVVMEMLFVFSAWAVILWRFFTAVYYFPKTDKRNHLSKYLKLDVRTFVVTPLKYIGFTEERVNTVVCILHCILQPCIWGSVVYIQVGKMGWRLCDLVIGKATRKCFMNEETQVAIRHLDKDEFFADSSHLDVYHSIRDLQPYSLLGESPYSLWDANKVALQKVRRQIELGKARGEDLWRDIDNISSIQEYDSDIFQKIMKEWYPSSSDDKEGDREKLFEESTEKSMCWKMELVWLITCILCWLCKNNSKNDEKQKSRDDERVDKAMDISERMWGILQLVDGVEKAAVTADKEFRRLQNVWKEYKLLNPSDVGHVSLSSRNRGYLLLLTSVRRPVEDEFYKIHYGEQGEWDFTDWQKQDFVMYLRKQCVRFANRVRPTEDLSVPNLLDCMVDQGSALVKFLGSSLQYCIRTRLRKDVIQSCWNSSMDLNEPELFESAIDIGKVQMLMRKAEIAEDG